MSERAPDVARESADHVPHPHYESAAPSDWMGGRAVEVMLSDLDFPLSKEKLLELAGRWEVPVTEPNDRVKMRVLLERIDERKRYRSARDVAQAIEHEWPELRE